MRRLPALVVAGAIAAAPVVVTAAAANAAVSTPFKAEKAPEAQPTITGGITLSRAVDAASLTITPAGGGNAISVVGCNNGSGISCSGGTATFGVAVSLPYNGTYNFTAVATHNDSDGALPTDRAESDSATGSFGLAVAPITPRRLTATPDGSNRTVTLTWQQNPEPDILGYVVMRSVDGGTATQANVPPGSGSTVKFVDNAGDGGQLTYQVLAVRPGATASATPVTSAQPATASTSIDRIAPTTTAPASGDTSGGTSGGSPSGATSSPGGGGTSSAPGGLRPQAATTPVRITGGGHVDLSGFKPNPVPLAVGPAPAPPDPGYQETLPYKPQTATTGTASQGGDEAALPVGSLTTTTDTNRRALMAFLAGAMLLFMLSMHLRWLLRRAAPVA